MPKLLDLLKEIPLSSDLREKLVDYENQMTSMESENLSLKKENIDLKTKLYEIEKENQGEKCPYCKRSTGELVEIKPHSMLGDIGVKIYHYKCGSCEREFDVQSKPQ